MARIQCVVGARTSPLTPGRRDAVLVFAARIGLIRTMVFAHIPSNVLLCLVPLAPTACLAVVVRVLRFSISQMDVPTRQSYTMAVVKPDERSAVSGVTTIARSVGASVSPSLASLLLASAGLVNVPLFRAGGLKTATTCSCTGASSTKRQRRSQGASSAEEERIPHYACVRRGPTPHKVTKAARPVSQSAASNNCDVLTSQNMML